MLGVVAYGAAWAFGSRALAVVGIGLALAGGAALVWRRLARGPLTLTVRAAPAPASEGDDVRLEVVLRRGQALPLAATSVELRWPHLEPRCVALRGSGRTLRGEALLVDVPRGIHRAERVVAVHEDPLGLERVSVDLPVPPPLLVRPRVVALDWLFADGPLYGAATRARRPRAGAADIRSVRPYREGEPLRGVHWPTTARRGALTMKELEDTSDGEPVVLLDCDPLAAVGRPPDTPFEAAVRAAGSIALAMARRGRSALLLTTGQRTEVVRIGPRAPDDALDALAGVEADARAPLAAVLAQTQGPLAGAREVIVVTARADAAATALLRSRASALVWVDAASWAGRRGPPAAGLAALAAAGMPVATVRRGDDLAAALGGTRWEGSQSPRLGGLYSPSSPGSRSRSRGCTPSARASGAPPRRS